MPEALTETARMYWMDPFPSQFLSPLARQISFFALLRLFCFPSFKLCNYKIPRPRLVNTYGVTEACIYQSALCLNHQGQTGSRLSLIEKSGTTARLSRLIAHPYSGVKLGLTNSKSMRKINGTNILWLHHALEAGSSFEGEIVISGEQVGEGYLNQIQLTTERFVKEDSMFFTGDMGRFVHVMFDGKPLQCIEYLGREDSQVKINGTRIEVEEVESVVKKCNLLIRDVVVTPRKLKSRNHLFAFVEVEKEACMELSLFPMDIIDRKFACVPVPRCLEVCLVEFCKMFLPKIMIPTRWVAVNSLDTVFSRNGKCDRKRLKDSPLPWLKRPEDSVGAESGTGLEGAALSELELRVAEIWANRLGYEVTSIQPWDTFAGLGGDSLDAQRISHEIIEFLKVRSKDLGNLASQKLQLLLPSQREFGEFEGPVSPARLLTSSSLRDFVRSFRNDFEDSKWNKDALSKSKRENTLPLYPVLYQACASGYSRIVDLLVSKHYLAIPVDAGVGSKTKPGKTPLHVAANNGHVKVVDTLLIHGANIFAQTKDKIPPLHLAANFANLSTANDPSHLDSGVLMSELFYSRIREKLSVDVVSLVRDGRGQTPIHCAARGGNPHTLVFVLKELKKDLLRSAKRKKTKAMKAAADINVEYVQAVNSLDRWHRSALHWSVINNNVQCVR